MCSARFWRFFLATFLAGRIATVTIFHFQFPGYFFPFPDSVFSLYWKQTLTHSVVARTFLFPRSPLNDRRLNVVLTAGPICAPFSPIGSELFGIPFLFSPPWRSSTACERFLCWDSDPLNLLILPSYSPVSTPLAFASLSASLRFLPGIAK